jgi:hypothetical protein
MVAVRLDSIAPTEIATREGHINAKLDLLKALQRHV